MDKAEMQYTPEDLLRMPDGDNYELVDGHLAERPMGARASYVAGRTVCILDRFCSANDSGWVFPGGASYCCFPDAPCTVRKPSASFIRPGRLPGEILPEGHILIAPDLAVEVLSPHDRVYEMDQRAGEYLRAGARLVWVINPVIQTVWVHHRDGSGILLRKGNELSGEDVMPGFRCPVTDLFRKPFEEQV